MPERNGIVVQGLADLNRAWRVADKETGKEFRKSLREAAEPVKRDAQRLAGMSIRNLHAADPWAKMRVGVTAKTVYVAPRKRGGRGRTNNSRPNLADLLLGRAMIPALNLNRAEVSDRVQDALDTVGRKWENS